MIRKKSETGWWEGELQARGRRKQIGWFPATYVKVLQSGRLSGRSTPVSGGKIQMNETILGNTKMIESILDKRAHLSRKHVMSRFYATPLF